MDDLSDIEQAFLAHVGAGGTFQGFAAENGYSSAWAKWKSREIRRKLGVSTIGEAVAKMAEENGTGEGVSRADFDKLTGLVSGLHDAIDELARAKPSEQPAAREQVQERQLSLKDHAAALGISIDDVKKLLEEKDYERFKANQERLERERAAEDEEDDDGEDEGGRGIGGVIRDGLGGIRNVQR